MVLFEAVLGAPAQWNTASFGASRDIAGKEHRQQVDHLRKNAGCTSAAGHCRLRSLSRKMLSEGVQTACFSPLRKNAEVPAKRNIANFTAFRQNAGWKNAATSALPFSEYGGGAPAQRGGLGAFEES